MIISFRTRIFVYYIRIYLKLNPGIFIFTVFHQRSRTMSIPNATLNNANVMKSNGSCL